MSSDYEDDYDDYEDYDDYDYEDDFADSNGRSALREASIDNPRDQTCPTCHTRNALTRKDAALGYQCDFCADEDEIQA